MSFGRDLLRAEAKKIYKEQAKSVPKKSRMPFAQFYKDYKKMKLNKQQQDTTAVPVVEDFNLEDVINVDNNVTVEQPENEVTVQEEEINE